MPKADEGTPPALRRGEPTANEDEERALSGANYGFAKNHVEADTPTG